MPSLSTRRISVGSGGVKQLIRSFEQEIKSTRHSRNEDIKHLNMDVTLKVKEFENGFKASLTFLI
jgi:hypothetical protein